MNIFIFYSNLKYLLSPEKYNWIENDRKIATGLRVSLLTRELVILK